MPDSKDDTHWMQLAIKHARKGIATCSPNPPVGAVIVKDNKIISEGFAYEINGSVYFDVHKLRLAKARRFQLKCQIWHALYI